jgi:CHASE2 domain-containing sensor protein/serine/threonine protein kinase
MDKERSPIATVKIKSGDRSQRNDTATGKRRWFRRIDWGRTLVGIWAIAATATTALDLGVVQLLERQVQTVFFGIRGPVAAPEDIVILAIDETSLSQGEFFRADPQQYAYSEPIQSWPWQRAAYAIAIEKLMNAGAKAVAIDVIFSTPGSYGEADDRRLAQAMQEYEGRVVLAAKYAELETPQGFQTQLTTPLSRFCDGPTCMGSINFYVEPNGRIHRLGEQFLVQLLQNSPLTQAEVLEKLPTFAKTTLQAAQVPYPPSTGDAIFFYGPAQTFQHIPFWHVLDPTVWEANLQSGAYFKDKIVLIGSTAVIHQDFHPAPFSESWLYPDPMPGIEIHANAIATLLTGKVMADAIPQALLRGLLVLLGVAGAGWLLSRPQTPPQRLAWAMGLAITWMAISYGLFVQGRFIVPTALPVGAILLGGFSQLILGSVKEQARKQQLRDTLKQYVTSPIVQEIISQQDDLQDLLRERELAVSGKVLRGRYRIIRVLGSGGFSETYVAEDLQQPGNPHCVVKKLRVVSNDPNTLRLARRLFATEAETLERLGQHDQIPQLFASFEEDHDFYLVQEFIRGYSLAREILPQRSRSEAKVIRMLNDLLEVLKFVHNQGVIHRDLKPLNVIRRESDGKLVLIDFGVAKKITTQLAESNSQTKFTVSVGTPGYMPDEQSAGRPQFNSDIYALGIIGIEALTSCAPHTLNHDAKTGAVIWMNQAPWVAPDLAAVLNKMVHHDFTQRYGSVEEVQSDLAPLLSRLVEPEAVVELSDNSMAIANSPTAIADSFTTSPNLEPIGTTSDEPADNATISLPDDWMKHQ